MRIVILRISLILSLVLGSSVAHADLMYGLVGWWRLQDGAIGSTCAGATVTDSSGNGNTGTCAGSPQWVSGIRKEGMSFNGSTQWITLGTPASINAVVFPYTVSFWANPTTLAQASVITSFDLNSTTYASACGIYNTSNVLLVGNPGYQYWLSGISTYLTAGQWAMWTLVWTNASTMTFYLNGVAETLTSSSGLWYIPAGNYIGARSTGRPFSGSIDDVRLYNRALSAQEVKDLYNSSASLNNSSVKNFNLSQ